MTRGHSLAVLVSVAFQGRGLGHCRYAMSGRENETLESRGQSELRAQVLWVSS